MNFGLRIALFSCGALIVACTPGPMTVASCAAGPAFQNYREADAVALPLRFENKMGSAFEVVAVCMSIDGQPIRQDDPAAVMAGFAAHKPLELRPMLRPDGAHRVAVVATFAGRGALEGYKFSVTSAHLIKPADLRSGVLVGQFTERAMPRPEERPTIEWTEAAAATPAPS